MPALPAADAAAMEAARARAELQFGRDGSLARYIRDLWCCYAERTHNAALTLNWPAGVVQAKLECFLTKLIDHSFRTKHPQGTRVETEWPAQMCQAAFWWEIRAMVECSDEWRQVQEKLVELAEWQASRTPADIIDQAAKERGYSHDGLAQEIGVSPDTLTRIKKEHLVSAESYRKVAEFLGCTPEDLKPPQE